MSKGTLTVVQNPLIRFALSRMRKPDTSAMEFRARLSCVTTLLLGKAAEILNLSTKTQETSRGDMQIDEIKERCALVPILRSGSGMLDAAQTLFPDNTPVYHLGLYREVSTLRATEYYNRLPASPDVDVVYVLDPLLATGGTVIAAVQSLVSWGMDEADIVVVCVLATAQGLSNFQKACPNTKIIVATADDSLDRQGRAQPGLGDVGDRLFGTR